MQKNSHTNNKRGNSANSRTMNMETMVVGSSDEEEDDVVVDDGWKGGS